MYIYLWNHYKQSSTNFSIMSSHHCVQGVKKSDRSCVITVKKRSNHMTRYVHYVISDRLKVSFVTDVSLIIHIYNESWSDFHIVRWSNHLYANSNTITNHLLQIFLGKNAHFSFHQIHFFIKHYKIKKSSSQVLLHIGSENTSSNDIINLNFLHNQ